VESLNYAPIVFIALAVVGAVCANLSLMCPTGASKIVFDEVIAGYMPCGIISDNVYIVPAEKPSGGGTIDADSAMALVLVSHIRLSENRFDLLFSHAHTDV
jgi:hypothetical protein